jgi:hypothetical protein
MIILDGELMPWSAIGQSLIESHFSVIDVALRAELDMLKKSGFDQVLNQTLQTEEYINFSNDVSNTSTEALKKKYGHQATNYTPIHEFTKWRRTVEDMSKDAEVYNQQLAIFATESELSYKPFDILKIIKNDSTEIIMFGDPNNYPLLNGEGTDLILDLSTEDYKTKAQSYFDTITKKQQMEGIVIKPFRNDKQKFNVPPYMKVRNSRYLSLVYGFDYTSPKKYAKLMKKKTIKDKLKASIKDEQMGRKMLCFPLSSINENNEEFKQLVANFLFLEDQVSGQVDPRL